MAGLGVTTTRYAARRRQRTLALIAAVLWVVGFEILPDVHLGLHDRLAPHTHDGSVVTRDGGDGPRIRVTYVAGHRHADGSWHAERSTGHVGSRRHLHAESHGGGPRHGANSLEHRGIAIHTPPPVIIEPLPVTRQVAWLIHEDHDALRTLATPVAVARGPPAG